MAMQFSLAHLTVLGCAPPEMTYIASRAGYDFISPRIIMMGNEQAANYALADNKTMLRQTKSALAETGMKVLDIELARIYEGVDICSYRPAFEVAAELAAKHVICSIWTSDRSYAVERLIELCDVAAPFGLTINLEFVTWAELKNLKEALEVLRAANRPNVGLLIDTLHFSRSRVSLEEIGQIPTEWFNFAHLCDAPAEMPTTKEGLTHAGREARLYLGEGAIDIASIVARMPEIPYSLEIPHLARVSELGYAEHACRCLETAKAYLSVGLQQSSRRQLSAVHAPVLR